MNWIAAWDGRGLMRRFASAVVVVVCGVHALAARAQSPDTDELLRRIGAYTRRVVSAFSNVVAEERYEQRAAGGRPRRLLSDFLLVAYPGSTDVFLTFRDVREVDGKPVRDQQERITQLFLRPFANAVSRARDISSAGQRHSLGPLNNPLAVFIFVQPVYQKNYRFTRQGLEPTLGPDVRRLDLVRLPSPTRAQARGSLWVSETTGEIVKTQLREGPWSDLTSTTTFEIHPRLGIRVPVEMKDDWGSISGSATYTNFRRFGVHTESTIEMPALPDQR
jgi:hypothetical protein